MLRTARSLLSQQFSVGFRFFKFNIWRFKTLKVRESRDWCARLRHDLRPSAGGVSHETFPVAMPFCSVPLPVVKRLGVHRMPGVVEPNSCCVACACKHRKHSFAAIVNQNLYSGLGCFCASREWAGKGRTFSCVTIGEKRLHLCVRYVQYTSAQFYHLSWVSEEIKAQEVA